MSRLYQSATQQKIEELLNENERLRKEKADLIEVRNGRANAMCEDKKTLAQAKEIIKLLLWDLRNRSFEPVKDIERAEQFLKEE